MQYIIYLTVIFISSIPLLGRNTNIINLGSTTQEAFVVREYASYLEDHEGNLNPKDLLKSAAFKQLNNSNVDFSQKDTSYAYWIRFSVANQLQSQMYRLEMFDYNIDKVTLYYNKGDSLMVSESGYSMLFKNRDLYHKNIGFLLSIPAGDTVTYLMKFKSNSTNVIEPIIRSIPVFYKYSIIEYTLLGFFYGITFIIILYNLVCFFILRKPQYFFYLMYMLCIILYLMSSNGTGFQFFWPNNSSVNLWIEIVSSAAGISFLLFFINAFLGVDKSYRTVKTLIIWTVAINLASVPFQIWHNTASLHLLMVILLIHVAFGIGFWLYAQGRVKSIFFLLSFVILDVGFVISWLERANIVSSSVWTVYSLYMAINLQFISISISMIQSVKILGDEKSKALSELLAVADKNHMMRILALKKQMSPHFIFNALNSILQRILSGNKQDASEYLVKLSKLIRKNLEQSDALYASLADELESLRIYLSLEAMRLGQSFQYDIDIDPHINAQSALIPSFIIQPFVENSIWHGLMPKEGDKNVWVKIQKNDTELSITIEDNGIGRAQSALQKKQHESTSQGMSLIIERIELLNKKYQINSSIEVLDLYNSENEATGTKVIIKTNFTNEQLYNSYHHR